MIRIVHNTWYRTIYNLSQSSPTKTIVHLGKKHSLKNPFCILPDLCTLVNFSCKKIKTYQVIDWTSLLVVGIPQNRTADMDHEDGINIPFLLSRAHFQVCVSQQEYVVLAPLNCPTVFLIFHYLFLISRKLVLRHLFYRRAAKVRREWKSVVWLPGSGR